MTTPAWPGAVLAGEFIGKSDVGEDVSMRKGRERWGWSGGYEAELGMGCRQSRRGQIGLCWDWD